MGEPQFSCTPMNITHYLHSAILVSELSAAEQFYGDILKLGKIDRTLNYPGAWYALGDIQIHLIEDKNLMPKLQNAEKWGRNPHLALSVESLAAAKDHLTDQGCEFQLSASGRAALFVQDPDGNVIELTEMS
jgi:glyoxylase I family protein